MQQDIPPHLIGQVASPLRFIPPSMRQMRAQAVQRLQIGLFGLAAMLLLVGLANIIMDRAREADAQETTTADIVPVAEESKPATDPLADIGVVPAADPTPTAAAEGQGNAANR